MPPSNQTQRPNTILNARSFIKSIVWRTTRFLTTPSPTLFIASFALVVAAITAGRMLSSRWHGHRTGKDETPPRHVKDMTSNSKAANVLSQKFPISNHAEVPLPPRLPLYTAIAPIPPSPTVTPFQMQQPTPAASSHISYIRRSSADPNLFQHGQIIREGGVRRHIRIFGNVGGGETDAHGGPRRKSWH